MVMGARLPGQASSASQQACPTCRRQAEPGSQQRSTGALRHRTRGYAPAVAGLGGNPMGCGRDRASESRGGTAGEIGKLGGDQLEKSSVEGRGFEPEKCSRSKRSSLELIRASRAFSFSICAISLSSCFIRFAYSISLCSNAILPRSNSISRISYSTTGCQLSLDNQRRQRGSEDRYSNLLIELEGWAPKEVDMVITRKECDQGEQKAGNERDCAL